MSFEIPLKLLNSMSSLPIEYGIYDFNLEKFIKASDPEWKRDPIFFEEHYSIMAPFILQDIKVGTCFDTALYIWAFLEDLDSKLMYIELENNSKHLVTYFKLNNLFYWIEYSWELEKGIHGPFYTFDELKNNFSSLFINIRKTKDNKIKKLIDDVDGDAILSFGNIISLNDFYSIIYL